MATFSDLPTELLLKIIHLEDSTDSDAIIARLGMTCRRLHGICKVPILERQLPIIRALVRRGSLVIFKKDSGSVAMKAEELQDVNDIFEASFDKFEYTFERFTNQEIGSVHGLIFYAHSIIDITIRLGPSESTYRDWHKPLDVLIRISSEKGQSNLTIMGAPYHGQGFRTFVPPGRHLRDCLSWLGFSRPHKDCLFIRRTQSGIIKPMEKENFPYANVNLDMDQGIKSFHINSPLPFYEACFPLTQRILNGRCIRKLFLSNTELGISDWSNILPLISMPLLLEFGVDRGYIAFNDLSLFLRRHPNVTHLDLFCIISKTMFPILWELLPRLEELRGVPDNLSMLLSRGKRSFPMLRSVTLKVNVRQTVQEIGAIDDVLGKLAQYDRATIHLCIQILYPIDLFLWFSEKNSKPASLESVKKLEIDMYGLPMSPKTCEAFFFWVPNYKFLFVQELGLKRIASQDPGIWTEQLNGLWDSHPELQSITLGEKVYKRPMQI